MNPVANLVKVSRRVNWYKQCEMEEVLRIRIF